MKEERPEMEEEIMQSLRSKATELLLREEWMESIKIYSQLVCLCREKILAEQEKPDSDGASKLRKTLRLALSNRAEARFRLGYFCEALEDCDRALDIENNHFKTHLCKGKILLNINLYARASDCFKTALLHLPANENSETLHGYLERSKRLEFQSRTGNLDLSDWVLSGFQGKSPELAEYIGAVQIKRSERSGRGLFATKDIEAGNLLLITKAVATVRGILPEPGENSDSNESARLVLWKDFIDRVSAAAKRCKKTRGFISTLSGGEDEECLNIPDISLFKPETEELFFSEEKIDDMGRLLNVLDVNCLTEDAISAKVLGKNCDYYGVGLWILASFINHSCDPNARRLHIGDHLVINASRDIKAGDEITFAYFDVLLPLNKRKELSKTWGFHCNCKRCRFEEMIISSKGEIKEIELAFERGLDMGTVVVKLEEGTRKWVMKGKEKGYFRASYWAAFPAAFGSEKSIRRWGRRIPAEEVVAECVTKAVGGDERVLRVAVEGLRKRGAGVFEMERALKLGRCVYGKVVKKQALRALLEL